MAIATINPATGETVKEFDEHTEAQVQDAIARAAETFRSWRRTSFDERAGLLRRAAEVFEERSEELARLATLEMGKTLVSARAEVAKCAKGCRWYADHTAEILADEPHAVEGARVFTRYEPIGPVLAVMPWNFPYWQVVRFAAPTLMAGNVGLLKHASNVPQVALALEDVFRAAGFPDGAFTTLLVSSKQIEAIIDDDRVRAVTLTGSEPAGRQVAARAGQNIKTSVLELGGSDAFVVMPSADLDEAVKSAVTSRMLNNGQSCINAKRFVVHADIAEEFARRMVEKMEALTIGDPFDEGTDVGPLASTDAVETIDQQVRATVEAGARLLTGGKPLGGTGAWYPPTVLADIPEGSPGHHEEFFGPVALLFTARDADDAIRIANDSPFGLGGSVWTRDEAEQERFVTEIETGMIYVNHFTESTPEVPFGGAKNSGYGRELAAFGPRSFVNAKTVWIQDRLPGMIAEPVVDQVRFTVEQFERMGETGILDPDVRYELLDGVITVMSPAGPGHAGTVNRVSALLMRLLFDRATITVQNPVKLGRRSEPQPDVAIVRLRRDFYSSAHPSAEDTYVAIEVSDSTLRTDRMIKLPLYSRQDIPEVWIVNLQDQVVEVYTRPMGDGYADLHTFAGRETFSPGAFPDLVITAVDLLGES